jgi:ATP-binding cassette subfamily B (MDR/TAP) protein 1
VQLVFGSLSETLGDFATGRLSKSQFEHEFSTFALYYIYLGVGQFVVTTVYTIVFTHIGNKVVSRTREIYLRTLLHQPMKFYDEKGAGEITAGLSVDFNVIQTAISNVIPEIIANLASFVAGVAIMFGESWKLALVALSVIVAVILAGAAPARLVTRESARAADAISASAGVAEESISSIRTTLAFGLQEPLISRFDIHQLKAQVASTKAKQGIGFIIAAVTGLLGLGYGLIFWQGSRFLVRGDITMARLVSVIYALIISTLSISTLPPRLDKLAVAKTAASNVFLIIQSSPPSYSVRCGSRPEKDWDGSVTFQDVSLAYPSRPDVTIMKGFSAHITAGKTTAIVGSSGSGKSSIISLLERFYDPSGGVILVDGRNILDLDLKWLRQRISLVEQQPVLFKTTIRQNILYGLVGTGHEGSADVEQRMIWAAQVANAHKFISDLPDGYDTEVGEKGYSLSGGQRQRIAIARAIIRDPRLLLLDEATSALDTESETVVQAALDNASQGRTTVVVAHRLSTIRNADNIIVVSNGSIVEQGSHDNLMARERTYFRMVHNQKMMAQEQSAANIPDDDITEPSNLRWSGNKELPELLPPATSQNEAEPAPVSPPARSVLKLAKFVSSFNKPESHLVALGACTAILAGSAHPVQGIFFAKCIASLAKPPSEFAQLRRDIDFWCSMYLWFAFFVFLVRLASQWSLAISSGRLLRRVRLTAFRSILRQDFEFFDTNAVGSLVSFLETQTENLAGISGSSFGLILTSITVLVAAVSVAVAITWKLGLVWAATMPILLFSGYFRFYLVKRAEKNIGSAFDESAGLACEAVSSIRTVFSLTREEDIVDEYRRQLSVQGGNAVRMNIFSSLLYATSQGLPFLCMAFGFYYGSRLLADQEINVFQFFVAFSQITFGADQAGVIFSQSPDIGRAMSAATYLKTLFDRRPRIDLEAGNPNLPINSDGGSLEFRNVSFTYPGRTEPAVRNLNIKVGPGKKIAFVGESGCGKSTALSLIERFYIPSSGQILINGEDISKINVQTYRAYMALVDQVPMLYRGTIKENLVFGLKRSVSDAVIFQACRDANIYEFIVSLP